MKRIVIKSILLIVLLTLSLHSKDTLNTTLNLNQVYFLPKQSKEVKDKIIDLIRDSKSSIDIAMYNFSYKKFAKELVKSSKKGVKITVIFDKSKVEKDDKIFKYLRKNGIKTIIPKEKLHTKMAIFDNKNFVLGSSNWTKESFKKNYEIILFSKDQKVIKEAKTFINNF